MNFEKQMEQDVKDTLGATDEWKEKNTSYGEIWKFKENKTLVGVFTGTSNANTKYGPKIVYNVETKSGVFAVFETAQIRKGFDGIEVGEELKIVYQGKGTTKNGQPVNLFKFYTK